VFYELGDLMENRIPKALANRLQTDDGLFDALNLDIQPYRFLVSLREDYLPDLEEWADLIPRLDPNRNRLLPMSIAQAQDAGGTASSRRRKQAQVEPSLLSLMCSGLNAERIKNRKDRLETGNLAKEGSKIIEDFYDNAFTIFPKNQVEQYVTSLNGT
jgi:hypothetical protein